MNRVQVPLFVALLSILTTSAVVATADQATPAAATPAAVPTKPAPAIAKPAPVNSDDQIVCKRQDELGSRLGGQKVCMTRRDWRQQSYDAGDAVNTAPRPH